jgi:hypothetical protein
MTINQCIKPGANVYLTDEQVEVRGDLFIVMGERGVTCVLHYVLPTHYVAEPMKDGQYDPRFDAVFDTRNMRHFGSLEQASFLDLGTPRVMVMGNDFAYLHKNIRDQLDAIVEVCEAEEGEDILSFLNALGIKTVDDNGDKIQYLEKDNGN